MPELAASRPPSLRWIAIAVFALASVLNYLDRQLLAAAAPALKAEFSLSNVQYGQLISVFSLVYAFSTPAAGLLLDRIGLRAGAAFAVLFWSAAGAATGLAQSYQGLIASRLALAIGESAAIPAGTKASATYLKSRELGLGTAAQSFGISAGGIAAPLLFVALAPAFGWRSVFFLSGALGLLWVPIWLFTSRRITPAPQARTDVRGPITDILRDRRLWGVAVANALVMTLYSLWLNWTTIYFVEEHGLTAIQANQRFAWIPPVFATLGGLFGASLAFRAIGDGRNPIRSRLQICWAIVPVLLITAAVPFVSSATAAAAAMAVSLFACLAILNNLQMIPVDVFGPGRAAFSGSVLACSFALMQTVLSPAIGSLVDNYGFQSVCLTLSVLPPVGVGVLTLVLRGPASQPADRPVMV